MVRAVCSCVEGITESAIEQNLILVNANALTYAEILQCANKLFSISFKEFLWCFYMWIQRVQNFLLQAHIVSAQCMLCIGLY